MSQSMKPTDLRARAGCPARARRGACLASGVAGLALLLAPLPGTAAEAAALGTRHHRLPPRAVRGATSPPCPRWSRRWARTGSRAALDPRPRPLERPAARGARARRTRRRRRRRLRRRLRRAARRHRRPAARRRHRRRPDAPRRPRVGERPAAGGTAPAPRLQEGRVLPVLRPDMEQPHRRGAVQRARYLPRRAVRRARSSYFECWNEPNQGTYLYPQVAGQRQERRRQRPTSRCSSVVRGRASAGSATRGRHRRRHGAARQRRRR